MLELAIIAELVEQIIHHLREADMHLAQGQTVGEVCRRIGVSDQSYYRWRKAYAWLKVEQARRLKVLKQEDARRMTSGELLKYRNGFFIRRSYGTHLTGSSRFTLTMS